MEFKKRGKTLIAGLAAGMLIGGGLATVTPAGAAVQQAAAAINWKNIWQTQIKPRADRRYYTKFKSNQRYYTKATSDQRYYTKTDADARYAPYPRVVRGVLGNVGDTTAGGRAIGTGYSFGVSFDTAPTAHIINPGDPLPEGCLGTYQAPDALPGHLCVFPRILTNVGSDTVCSGANNCPGASRYGFFYIAFSSAAGLVDVTGSWAARPAAGVTASARPAAPGGGGHAGGPSGR